MNFSQSRFFISFSLFSALVLQAAAATNDLVINSITRVGDCTTLQWRSHPREYYTVYWTDDLRQPVFWRVAEVNVPSGGTNTTWTESGCQESMMASAPPPPTMSPEVRAKFLESMKGYKTPAWLYPPGHPKNPDKANPVKSPFRIALEESGGLAGALALSGSSSASGRFYRVARTAVAGFIDGWGGSLGDAPENLAALGDAFAISASPRDLGAHSLAVLTNGLVVAWGHASQGQCNVPTNLADVVAVAAGGRHSLALTRDGDLVMWGDDSLGQRTNQPAGATNLCAIAAGLWHSMALRADGRVFAWGDLFNGTNSVPAGLSNVTAIAAGPRTCLALKADGTVTAWGFDYAMLGNALATNVPASLSNVIAISAGMGYNQALLRDGTMRLWGVTNLNAQMATPFMNLSNLLATSAGWHYGLALSNNATVARWGQTGGGEGMDAVVALSAGAGHVLVLRTNSSAPVIRRQPADLVKPAGTSSNIFVVASSSLPLRYQWRKDGADLPGNTNATLTFANLQDPDDGLYQVRVSNDVGDVFSRQARVLAIRPPVITNQAPELDLCRPQFAPEERLRVGVHTKIGGSLFYYWYRNGQMFSMGANSVALRFRGTNDEGQYHVVVGNIAGSATSAVWTVKVRLQGEATGWGSNYFGQTLTSRRETNFVAIASGAFHNLGLRENGTVHGWGENTHGQSSPPVGLSNVTAIAAGNVHSLALREDGSVVAWGWNEYGQTNVSPEATNIVSLAAGTHHNLALRKDGVIVGWGRTNEGALQLPADLTNVVQVAAGDGLSFALMSNGTVRAWGSGPFGPVTIPAGLSNVVQLDAAFSHSLALKRDGSVIGLGLDSGWGETVAPAGLSNVLQVAAGYYFSVALKNDGTVTAWGCSDAGQTNVPAGLGDVKQVAAGYYHALALAYSPVLNYPVNVPQDLLLIYNTNCADSAAVMNYYRTNRPLIEAANVLGVGGATNAVERYANLLEFTNTLLTPFQIWLDDNPTKRPLYIVMAYGVPAAIIPTNGLCKYTCIERSTSFLLSSLYPNHRPFVTHLNMRTPEDCFAYVDKVRWFGTNYSPGKVYISARQGGYGNGTYYFDDTRAPDPALIPHRPGFDAVRGVLASGAQTSSVAYTDSFLPRTSPSYCTNLAGYLSWGWHGFFATYYPTNGQLRLYGDSAWFPIMSIESFNGQWVPHDNQTSYHFWFVENAFFGQDYQFTPVGAVSHIYEPFIHGVNDSYRYFGLWEFGRSFGRCAWLSRRTVVFQATGDPFLIR